MGIILFTVLNAIFVIFMLYVLAQFWKEGHRHPNAYRKSRIFDLPRRTRVLVVTHEVARRVQRGQSVIPMQARAHGVKRDAAYKDTA